MLGTLSLSDNDLTQIDGSGVCGVAATRAQQIYGDKLGSITINWSFVISTEQNTNCGHYNVLRNVGNDYGLIYQSSTHILHRQYKDIA